MHAEQKTIAYDFYTCGSELRVEYTVTLANKTDPWYPSQVIYCVETKIAENGDVVYTGIREVPESELAEYTSESEAEHVSMNYDDE